MEDHGLSAFLPLNQLAREGINYNDPLDTEVQNRKAAVMNLYRASFAYRVQANSSGYLRAHLFVRMG